jgi:hypothetical protein
MEKVNLVGKNDRFPAEERRKKCADANGTSPQKFTTAG